MTHSDEEVVPRGTWRLMVDSGHDGAHNMAVDEALALAVRRTGVPVLRLYRFEPPAVTVGRRQGIEKFDAVACMSEGVDIVRRPTGGLAILHQDDFTYSVAIPSRAHGPSIHDRVFKRIAAAITCSLELLGIRAILVDRPGNIHAGGNWCFDSVFGVDLSWNDRKICGSAQRVFESSVLQHGTLFLEDNSHLLSRLAGRKLSMEDLSMVTVSQARGTRVSWEELKDAFLAGFSRSLSCELEPSGLSSMEEETAARLLDDGYEQERWHSAR